MSSEAPDVYWLILCPLLQATPASPPASAVHLSSLIIYPIKSCAGMAVGRWPLGPSGLLFDREWALVDSNGRALRLKACPSMCRVRPRVCLETQRVMVQAPGMEDLCFSLSAMPPPERSQAVSVCGEACAGVAYDATISSWFSRYLGVACTLVRNSPYAQSRKARTAGDRQKDVGEEEGPEGEGGKERTQLPIAFANEAQFLLVSTASVDHLNGLIAHQVDLDYEFRYQVRGRSTTERQAGAEALSMRSEATRWYACLETECLLDALARCGAGR